MILYIIEKDFIWEFCNCDARYAIQEQEDDVDSYGHHLESICKILVGNVPDMSCSLDLSMDRTFSGT